MAQEEQEVDERQQQNQHDARQASSSAVDPIVAAQPKKMLHSQLSPQAIFSQLLERLKSENESIDESIVKKAFTIAMVAHGSAVRKTGESYVMHPLRIVASLIDLHFCDEQTICAAFLHDVLEESTIPKEQLAAEFGNDIANIVDSLTVLDTKQVSLEERKAQNLRKIILAMVKDIRVLIIKLADRLDNMRTIEVMSDESKKRNSEETLNVYAPLAEKIGLYGIKAELEDLALRWLEPAMFTFIKSKVTASKEEREQNTRDITRAAERILAGIVVGQSEQLGNGNDGKHAMTDSAENKTDKNDAVTATIKGRAKHFYSIYKKMVNENKTIAQIYDLYGLRITVKTAEECYQTLHMFEQAWQIIPDRFKDYIKEPKANGYQSLHQNFIVDDKVVEVQIRTKEMDAVAELGIATHWKYKNTGRDRKLERKISWIRQLLSWKQRSGNGSPQMQFSLFKDEIICITPKGDPVILADGATPVDFAYLIHSDIGDRMKVAKVNGTLVPFDTKLHSGDIVSIETAKDKTVSNNWLSMANHTSTQQKIRRALGIEGEQLAPRKKKRKLAQNVDIANAYQTLEQFRSLSRKTPIKVSHCCNPGIEDPIVAFYTKGKKLITVHKITCPNQYALDQRLKVILATPAQKQHTTTQIDILIDDTPGAFVNILDLIFEHKITVKEVENKDAGNVVYLSIKVAKHDGSETLVEQIKKLPGVKDAKLAG